MNRDLELDQVIDTDIAVWQEDNREPEQMDLFCDEYDN